VLLRVFEAAAAPHNQKTQDLSNGIVLINLVEQLTGTKCQLPYKPNPTNRTFMIDNMNIALKYLSGFVSGSE
jgi:hypothetical protein